GVLADRVMADSEDEGDLRTGFAIANERQNLRLAPAEAPSRGRAHAASISGLATLDQDGGAFVTVSRHHPDSVQPEHDAGPMVIDPIDRSGGALGIRFASPG